MSRATGPADSLSPPAANSLSHGMASHAPILRHFWLHLQEMFNSLLGPDAVGGRSSENCARPLGAFGDLWNKISCI